MSESEKVPVEKCLLIGTWSSECGACNQYCDPYSETHDWILPGMTTQPRRKGCGTRWTYVTASYLGMDEIVAGMRPDLIFVPPLEVDYSNLGKLRKRVQDE